MEACSNSRLHGNAILDSEVGCRRDYFRCDVYALPCFVSARCANIFAAGSVCRLVSLQRAAWLTWCFSRVYLKHKRASGPENMLSQALSAGSVLPVVAYLVVGKV